MASSGTTTTRSTHCWAIGNIRSPTRFGASVIAGNSAHGAVDRAAGPQRTGEGRRRLGFDADTPDAVRVPRRYAADESASSHRHQQCIYLRGLLLTFQAGGSLPQQGFLLVERMHHQSPGCRGALAAGLQGLVIVLPCNYQFRAVCANAIDLLRRSDVGHEDLGVQSKLHRGISHGRAVIAAGSRDDAYRGSWARNQVCKRTAPLERPPTLTQFHLPPTT